MKKKFELVITALNKGGKVELKRAKIITLPPILPKVNYFTVC